MICSSLAVIIFDSTDYRLIEGLSYFRADKLGLRSWKDLEDKFLFTWLFVFMDYTYFYLGVWRVIFLEETLEDVAFSLFTFYLSVYLLTWDFLVPIERLDICENLVLFVENPC